MESLLAVQRIKAGVYVSIDIIAKLNKGAEVYQHSNNSHN